MLPNSKIKAVFLWLLLTVNNKHNTQNMATPEDHFQAKIVHDFYDKYPHLHGCLIEINNDAKGGIKKIMHRIAMGMQPGASDLVLFANGVFSGIECKAEGKKHSRSHLETQQLWGKTILEQGGNYIMSCNYDEIFSFIEKALNGETGMYFINKNYILK